MRTRAHSTASARVLQHWEAAQKAEQAQDWLMAETHYGFAARLMPNEAVYGLKLAVSRLKLQRPADAEQVLLTVLQGHPEHGIARQLLVQALAAQHRYAEALEALRQLPSEESATQARLLLDAELCLKAEHWQEAIAACLQILQSNVNVPQAHLHMGIAFLRLDRPKEAALCLETALAVGPSGSDRLLALSLLTQQLRQAADWSTLQARTQELLQAMDQQSDAELASIQAFSLLSIPSTPAQQLRQGRIQATTLRANAVPLPPRSIKPSGKLRIGYLSNDFYRHATAHLITHLLESHDRSQVEVFLYCHSPEDHSAIQHRLRSAADGFRDVRHLTDLEAAQRMHDDGIDIAIDLKGYTRGTRMQILAYRPAPIQVSYLGYPGTTGADFIDYVLGDPIVTPMDRTVDFNEHIAQMPFSYQPNDGERAVPAPSSRTEQGLPEDAVVLCSFNQVYKLSPEIADLWAEILRQTPQAVLWQLIWSESAAARLVQEFQARGISPERLFFSPRTSPEENLARLPCADLMLDTWPYNAHTTASEALWMGVPVLTVPGATFASRVASSLVRACGLPELSCPDASAYVERAVALANHPAELRRLQLHLREQRHSLPLFDTARYARDFDRLLLRMWARHEQGLPPAALPAQASEPLAG